MKDRPRTKEKLETDITTSVSVLATDYVVGTICWQEGAAGLSIPRDGLGNSQKGEGVVSALPPPGLLGGLAWDMGCGMWDAGMDREQGCSLSSGARPVAMWSVFLGYYW